MIAKLSIEITVIIIAHRLSTVKDCESIIFLENGHITGQGSHQDLYANHEDYQRYVDEQMIHQA